MGFSDMIILGSMALFCVGGFFLCKSADKYVEDYEEKHKL